MSEFIKTDSGALIFKGAYIIGDVKIGKDSNVWPGSVIRGDTGRIIIGENTNIQDNSVLHLDCDELIIGDYVSIGHNSIIHNQIIGDNSLIGMGAILLNGVKIGKNSLIGAGSLVTEGTVIGDGELWFGNPAKYRRHLSEEEIDGLRKNADHYLELAKEYLEGKFTCMK